MSGYRCYLMSGETIQAVQSFECADDAKIILTASAFLDSKSQHAAAESWEGKRLVARLTRNPTDEASQQDNAIRVVKQDDDRKRPATQVSDLAFQATARAVSHPRALLSWR